MPSAAARSRGRGRTGSTEAPDAGWPERCRLSAASASRRAPTAPRRARARRRAGVSRGSPPHHTQVGPAEEGREQVAEIVRVAFDGLDPERAEAADEILPARLVLDAQPRRFPPGQVD